jgi:epoxyqueuosine reductase
VSKTIHTKNIKAWSKSLGFDYCGITKAVKLDEDAFRLESWLNNSYQGKMQYLENHFDLRIDPQKLVPGAKSVITFLMNYYPEERQQNHAPQISKYAFGNDYHQVIREKINHILRLVRSEIGEINGRGFVDSAPVLERSWAVRSGLGWVGKNGNLINKQSGSFFFIATLIIDLELEYDDLFAKDFCGSCTRCIDSCPTDAIMDNKIINGSRCISYFTIELKDALLPEEMKNKFSNWMFGCDICQDVCPWNRFSKPTTEPGFSPIHEVLNFTKKDWAEVTEETFKQVFKNSPLKRSKFEGIKRNLKFLQE